MRYSLYEGINEMLSEQEAERTKKIDDIELMGNASSVGFAVGVETKFRLARVLVGLTIVALLAGFLLAVGLRPIVSLDVTDIFARNR